MILPEYADQPEFQRGFMVEAQLVARLEHAHIIPLDEQENAYMPPEQLMGDPPVMSMPLGLWLMKDALPSSGTYTYRHRAYLATDETYSPYTPIVSNKLLFIAQCPRRHLTNDDVYSLN